MYKKCARRSLGRILVVDILNLKVFLFYFIILYIYIITDLILILRIHHNIIYYIFRNTYVVTIETLLLLFLFILNILL